MEEERDSLERLKSEYKVIAEKFSLPSFEEMNKEFQIEKICGVETDYLVREVARMVSEKLSDFLKFIESLIHPVDGSILVFSILKTLGNEERGILKELYKEIAKIELKMIKLGLFFEEEKEAEFIREGAILWDKVKTKLIKIFDSVEENWEKDFKINGSSSGYFS
jgi:hypothetical protein